MGPGGMGDSQVLGMPGPYIPSLPRSQAFPTLGCRKPLGGAHLGCHPGSVTSAQSLLRRVYLQTLDPHYNHL